MIFEERSVRSPDSNVDVGKTVARALLRAGCVSARMDEPFRLPSGWASPVYMDCRRLISFPQTRRLLVARGIEMLRARGCLDDVAAVVGGESSGIALGAWVAEALDLPLAYVRKKPVGGSQIEGVIHAGDRVLLVDDLMAAGHSKQKFCAALTAAGARVHDVLVIFDYGTFPTADLLRSLGLRVHALAQWTDVLHVAREDGSLESKALDDIEAFLADPTAWSQAHGGIGTVVPVNQPDGALI